MLYRADATVAMKQAGQRAAGGEGAVGREEAAGGECEVRAGELLHQWAPWTANQPVKSQKCRCLSLSAVPAKCGAEGVGGLQKSSRNHRLGQ